MVILTVSLDTHEPFVIVHINCALLPAVKPVTAVVGFVIGKPIVAPLLAPKNDQAPVPEVGIFAAIVKEPLLQLERSDPAVATCDVLTVVVVVAVTAAVHPTDDV